MASSLTVQIGGTNYQILSFSIKNRINERTQFDMVAIDTANTAVFSKGEKIVVTDTNLGTLFTGFIYNAEPLQMIGQPYTFWQINCVDYHYVADKRTVVASYTNQYAGYIALDMLQSTLASEGVSSQYAIQHSTTQSDFAAGTLSTTSSTNNVGDGDLELTSSSSVSASYKAQSDWNTGIFSNLQANSGGDVSLIGQTRNWNDGNKSQQTLYGAGSPSDSVSNGAYILNCSAAAATISRLDFAGTVTNGTIECDITLGNSTVKPGFTWRQTVWNNTDDYAYAVELSTAKLDVRKGNNGAGGSTSSLGSFTFSPAISTGTYTVKVVVNGSSFTASVVGTSASVNVSDGSYASAGYIALRNRNPGANGSNAQQFDNFAIFTATTGTWTGPSTSINAITVIASTIVSWDVSLSQGGTILVQTSTNGGSTYQTASNGGPIPGLNKGGSGAGLNVRIKVTLTATSGAMPDIRNLAWAVVAGYSSPGTRSTAPLVTDTMVRANQSGWSPSFDGQTITKVGTGTDAIAANEATLTNTTGNCHEHYGSTTGTDEDGTVNFSLSASTINGAMELRFTDANNFYQLVASTTALSIVKMLSGTQTTLATATVALSINTTYVLRFRVAGSAPALLWGRVWAKGTLEPSVWAVTAQDAGTVAIPLTLYGSKVASGTLATAARLASGTGGTEGPSANNTPATNTTGYMEISPLGGVQPINAALPATPSGKGWLWDVTTLEGQQLNTGNYQFNVGVADTHRPDSNVTLVWRAWKYNPTGPTYTSIGNITLTAQTVNRTRTNFVFGPSSLSTMSFSTGDKYYFELYAGNITWNTSTFINQRYVVWVSTSGTAGVNNDAMTTTPSYQATGTGNIASGGFALMANGTGTTSFDHFRVTQYPDPSLSLSTVQRVGSTFFTWDATLATNTTLGMDLSSDGVNWYDMSSQNGGALPFINGMPQPTLDYFNADTSANYTQTNQTGGSSPTWTWDTTNNRLVATGGTNGILLSNTVNWMFLPVADIDLFCDLDQADASGLVWQFQDTSNFYVLVIADASSSVGTTNQATLYKVVANVATQLFTASITFTRGTYHRFRVTMLAGVITATMDGNALFTYTDNAQLGAGQVGLWSNGGSTGSRFYTLWVQPQGDYVGGTPYGDVVSAQFVYSRQRLATTDNTVTPQVLDMTIGITDPNIGLGTLIPTTNYATTFVSANMDDITNKSANYAWKIDQNTKLHFQTQQTTPAPWLLDSRDTMVQKLRIIYDAPGYSNRQQLTNVISSIAFTDTKIGDSNSRSFALSYPNAAAPVLTLNGNPQSVGVKGVDINKNWYWQYGDPTIYQDAGGTVMANTDTLSVTGTGLTTTTVTRDNLAAQAVMAAQEGSGTGIVEAVTDTTQFGMNVAAAQAYGDQLNARWATLGRTFKFETTRTGLAPGQLLPGFVLSRGISNAQLFITSVEIQARAYATAVATSKIQVPRIFGGTIPFKVSSPSLPAKYIPRVMGGTIIIPGTPAQAVPAGIRYVSTIEASETPYSGSWARKLAVKKR